MKPIIKGIAASNGKAEGIVRIVHDSGDTLQFKGGEVIVTRMTEPTMVIMMNKAAAVVTDAGGLTCHAAIVSRELGIPSVVGTKSATTVLKDGMKVLVDGTKGEVYKIDS